MDFQFSSVTPKKDRGLTYHKPFRVKPERHYRKTAALVLAPGDQMAVHVTYVSVSRPMKIGGLQNVSLGSWGLLYCA